MRRPLLTISVLIILASSYTAMALGWPQLFLLVAWGQTADGTVVSYDGLTKGSVHIQFKDSKGKTRDFETACGEFDCAPQSLVLVSYLGSNPNIHFPGDLSGEFLAMRIAVFLFLPIAGGAMLYYSVSRAAARGWNAEKWVLRYLPFAMALPIVIGTLLSLSSRETVRYRELLASVTLTIGCILYYRTIREARFSWTGVWPLISYCIGVFFSIWSLWGQSAAN